MEQIKIEIPGPGALQAGIKLLLGALLVVALHGGVKLGGDGIGVSWIAIRHRRLERLLALPQVVYIGGIKIGAARSDEPIRHLAHLGHVDAAVRILGQAHQAEAQLEGVEF